MILLDTNILIEILKGNPETQGKIQTFNQSLAVSSISAMELYYGARDKAESRKLEKFIALFKIIHLNEAISMRSITLIKSYAKSHGLDIPDSLIAGTALVSGYEIYTYNLKDFKYIDGLALI